MSRPNAALSMPRETEQFSAPPKEKPADRLLGLSLEEAEIGRLVRDICTTWLEEHGAMNERRRGIMLSATKRLYVLAGHLARNLEKP